MTPWRQQGELWTLEPTGRPRGLIEFIGGSYLAATPQLSYRRFLEALANRGWRIHAWSYVPGFDHQSQSNAAWRLFRQWREQQTGQPEATLLRLGHSLGCKLHLLAPDGGRRCDGLVALSFNNFSAERSIPFLAELGQQFRFRSEFSPSPEDTLVQIANSYRQPRNLLVRFSRDSIDQSGRLIGVLQARTGDASTLVELPGDHLTPASGGLRKQFLGDWADDPARQRGMERLAEQISTWAGAV
ncbi:MULTISPECIES: DUF1350 family protein [unclassified Cyanobium]|uniref:DUF1350 family protein n=1 Tax=unclassified Cyanobium TaxID=2627006 RepID=UPI0020CEFAC6|nr:MULTISPECIES: DUF1350 family protein [unclassified Cyanobium]MCP9834597.1 DUF1350 family protein [Cyanobium sp. La Preciosa 7G6]MCP9937360.1 DUF1350 family protein [Cyanobium sp. Aljojuca 7A6]